MRMKDEPEDFVVHEETEFPIGRSGPFAVYRLDKEKASTLWAIRAISRRWRIEGDDIAFGGLKDHQAKTSQHVTIFRGPPEGFTEDRFSLVYLGQADRPFTSRDIVANAFTITVREIEATSALPRLQSAAAELVNSGVPNYFDSQRFGCVGASGQFPAVPWMLGNFEGAVRLWLTDDNTRDRPDDRQDRRLLREHWGNWRRLAPDLSDPVRRSVVEFLAGQPRDFRRAITRFPAEDRRLQLEAFQSHLWNGLVVDWLGSELAPEQRLGNPGDRWASLFYRGLTVDQQTRFDNCRIFLPTARQTPEPGPWADRLERVTQAFLPSSRQLRVKYPRDSFLSKGERAAIVRPQRFSVSAADDDRHPGASKLVVRFALPRGSYATLIIKRLLLAGQNEGIQTQG